LFICFFLEQGTPVCFAHVKSGWISSGLDQIRTKVLRMNLAGVTHERGTDQLRKMEARTLGS